MVNEIKSPVEKLLGGRHLYLASASPRRRELMMNLGCDVRLIEPREVDESWPESMRPEVAPVYISRKKAEAYCHDISSDMIVVTADTVVIADGKVLGKPHTAAEGREMLQTLSSKKHVVVTGVTLTTTEGLHSFASHTNVYFDALSDEVIDYYIENYQPFDKAGAYGIQEWIGYIGIKAIEGCYYNVMGLPVHDLFKHLALI